SARDGPGFGGTPCPGAGGIALRAAGRPALPRAQYIHVLLVAIPPAPGHGSLHWLYRRVRSHPKSRRCVRAGGEAPSGTVCVMDGADKLHGRIHGGSRLGLPPLPPPRNPRPREPSHPVVG